MQDKVGDTFNGIITSVNSFGVFVELDEIYVDGLVHISALQNDYYHYDPVGHRLTGERTGKVLRLGDPLTIVVTSVNLNDRKIDFVPAAGVVQTTDKKDTPRNKRKARSAGSKPDISKQNAKDTAPTKKKKSSKKKIRKKRAKRTKKKR
jgi:ribonuclease R